MVIESINKNIDGGKAFAEGAYGCVFRPALKCKNETHRRDGVSKLMMTDKSYSEYNEISGFLKVLSKIPNHRSLFMFPHNICRVAPLDKKIDLPNFNKNCDHFSKKGKINSKTINKPSNLNKLRIINLPDGGNDVDIKMHEIKTPNDLLKLNNSLLRLLKYGIVPMNYYKIYHFDIKDTNVLIDNDFTARLTDWGLSGMIDSKDAIPSIIANRPLQSNLPFSNILFNPGTLSRYDDFYNQNKQDYTFDKVIDFMTDEFDFISRDVGHGHYDYLEPIYRYIFNDKGFSLKHEIITYISQVVFEWKHPKYGFDLKKYFFKVFLPNADIWGFITIYFSFFSESAKMNNNNPIFFHKLRQLFIRYLFTNSHKPINIKDLFIDIKDLNNFLKKNDYVDFIPTSPRSPETKFLHSTKTISFNVVQTGKKKNVEKIMKRASKNKTRKKTSMKTHKSHSTQSTIKETKKKRLYTSRRVKRKI